jgi:DNA-binding CsgD family transcriptional regulator
MQLHLRLGEAMEMLLPIDPNPCLGELAYHFCQGAPIGDAGRGIRYSIEAGDRAIEVGAFEEAAELYQRGLDVLNELSPTDIERLAELRSKLDLAIELIKASRPVQPTAVSRLTPRELEVLGLIARGRSNKEIARHLHLAEKTVKAHVSSVLGKLGVADRTQAAVLAVRQSLDR